MDTACSCKECRCAEGQLVRCRNDIDVVRRVLSDGGEWTVIDGAREITHCWVGVVEIAGVRGDRVASVVLRARRCVDAEELNS